MSTACSDTRATWFLVVYPLSLPLTSCGQGERHGALLSFLAASGLWFGVSLPTRRHLGEQGEKLAACMQLASSSDGALGLCCDPRLCGRLVPTPPTPSVEWSDAMFLSLSLPSFALCLVDPPTFVAVF